MIWIIRIRGSVLEKNKSGSTHRRTQGGAWTTLPPPKTKMGGASPPPLRSAESAVWTQYLIWHTHKAAKICDERLVIQYLVVLINVPGNTQEYFKRSVGISVLDEILATLDKRFGSEQIKVAKLISLSPEICVNKPIEELINSVTAFAKDHKNLFTPEEIIELENEIRVYQIRMIRKKECSIESVLSESDTIFFQVSKILRVLVSYPITSCEAERSFSSLRRLVSWSRSSMSAERAHHLSIMMVHRKRVSKIDVTQICELFKMKKSRRLFK